MPKHATSPSSRLAADRPTRGADRDRALVNESGPATDGPLLPSLDEGITLLDVEGGRGVPVVQSLVLDRLLLHDGPAFWVDANGHATTATLARIAPGRRLLERIHVARGFTAYQHYGAVDDLPAAVNRSIRHAAGTDGRRSAERDEPPSPRTPSLIVAPAVDARYRDEDTLDREGATTLQARTLARLAAYADGYDVPVLLTRSAADEFTAPVETAADHRLRCEQTRLGPRFVGDGFETLVYPVDDGTYYQTTFAYWRQLLAARATRVGLEPAAPSAPPTAPSTSDPAGVGTGVTADGGTASLTANPLLDAWTAADGGGR